MHTNCVIYFLVNTDATDAAAAAEAGAGVRCVCFRIMNMTAQACACNLYQSRVRARRNWDTHTPQQHPPRLRAAAMRRDAR